MREIDEVVEREKDTYKSRSGFINAAIHRELRRINQLPKEEKDNGKPQRFKD